MEHALTNMDEYDADRKSAGDIVVEALRAEGVTTIFGIVGSHVVGIYEALRRAPDIRAVSARHEGAASFMATGMARLTGEVGVTVVTAGPGVLNALNGVTQAEFSAEPIVIMAGGPPLGAKPYELHGLASEEYCVDCVRPLVKFAARAQSLEELAELLSRAFQISRSGRPGPAYIEIPWNLFVHGVTACVRYEPSKVVRNRIDPASLQEACDALALAERPLLIIDKGVLHQEGRSQLAKLAGAFGAGLAVTRDALGAVDENHPLYCGVVHDHNFGPFGFDAVERADVCLLFGFDAGADNARIIEMRAGGALIQLKETESFEGKSLSEACAFLMRSRQVKPTGQAFRNEHIADKHARVAGIESDPRANLFLRTLASVRKRMLPNDISVIDAGNHEVWARTILPISGPRSCIGGANWASMGYALPTAIATRVVHPAERVFCITGDGCLLMSLSDLTTFFEVGGPSILLLLNDSEYGMMTDVQKARFGKSYQSALPPIDFAALAQAMGGRAHRIEAPGDIEPVLDDALTTEVPVLLDIVCGRPPLPVFPAKEL